MAALAGAEIFVTLQQRVVVERAECKAKTVKKTATQNLSMEKVTSTIIRTWEGAKNN